MEYKLLNHGKKRFSVVDETALTVNFCFFHKRIKSLIEKHIGFKSEETDLLIYSSEEQKNFSLHVVDEEESDLVCIGSRIECICGNNHVYLKFEEKK